MFEVNSLSLKYNEAKPLFGSLSFKLNAGDCLLVKGSNGCGKTSLLYALANVIPQHIEAHRNGNISLNRQEINNIPLQNMLPNIGLVMQNPAWQLFFPTVREELIYSLENLGINEDEITIRINQALNKFNLTELSEANPLTLSMGYQKLLTIAIIDTVSPTVMLLDEPLNGLSEQNQMLVTNWIIEQRQLGKILLIAEHNPVVTDYCNHILEFKADGYTYV